MHILIEREEGGDWRAESSWNQCPIAAGALQLICQVQPGAHGSTEEADSQETL